MLHRTKSDPSTVLTTMTEAEKINNQAGQNITIFTGDQQLYRVTLEAMWRELNHFQHFISPICGMH